MQLLKKRQWHIIFTPISKETMMNGDTEELLKNLEARILHMWRYL